MGMIYEVNNQAVVGVLPMMGVLEGRSPQKGFGNLSMEALAICYYYDYSTDSCSC